jgi:outer membrane murein-binding lipoprotein Lpp
VSLYESEMEARVDELEAECDALNAEVERLRADLCIYEDALWKACGDDGAMVTETLESQGWKK